MDYIKEERTRSRVSAPSGHSPFAVPCPAYNEPPSPSPQPLAAPPRPYVRLPRLSAPLDDSLPPATSDHGRRPQNGPAGHRQQPRWCVPWPSREDLCSRAAVVFSKSYCPYSKATKQTLAELRADYTAIELDIECTSVPSAEQGDGIADARPQPTAPTCRTSWRRSPASGPSPTCSSRRSTSAATRKSRPSSSRASW